MMKELLSVEARLEIARGALADIAFSEDMTLTVARRKAKRIYEETGESANADEEPAAPPQPFVCKNCGRELVWWEAPFCHGCGQHVLKPKGES